VGAEDSALFFTIKAFFCIANSRTRVKKSFKERPKNALIWQLQAVLCAEKFF
jgi:hypothetical protein